MGQIYSNREIFSDSDVEKLEADGSEAAKIILMLIYTGMRIGELFSLPLQDYHKTYVVGGEKTDRDHAVAARLDRKSVV